MRQHRRGVVAALAVAAWIIVSLPAGTGSARGGIISAVGSAETVTEGPNTGWFKYSYEVVWDLDKGLSHLDLILKPGCLQPDHLFRFDSAAGTGLDGFSTGAGYEVGDPPTFPVSYRATFEPAGDPSMAIPNVLIKWEPAGDEPGKTGVGRFWYYSNVIPEYGTVPEVVVAKNGRYATAGDLVGAWPSCQVPHHLPEPATLAFVGAGLVFCVAGRLRALRVGRQ